MSKNVIKQCGGLTSDLAPYYVNTYTWCKGLCKYCWAKHYNTIRTTDGWIKRDIPKSFDRALNENPVDGVIWINNFADGYQPVEKTEKLTRECIKVAHDHGAEVLILTKFALAVRDLKLEPDWVGISLISLDDKWRLQYEPYSDVAACRIRVIEEAKEMGLKTLVNVEPLLREEDFLPLYFRLHHIVDRFLVGKLNPRQKNRIDFEYPDYDVIKGHIIDSVGRGAIEFKSNW